ncbi:Clp protease [Pseudomonas putida]|uniref:ATP-dependent Clp protease proteolytic subunit n=1 Tax=Pseudomonas putida TaxID=303 RepID=UPI00117B4BF4|nr:ATP-dependent Clp protease proteolytic subunit [Pseudomonas putida]TRO29952.1 Clp protease [Pseudomonas putida]
MTLHIVHFSGAVNPAACYNIQSTCLQALTQGATRIRLHLASEGGSTLYGFALYNFLRSLPVAVDTHNLGSISSMANIVFLAGEVRTACQHSRFLQHPLNWHYNAGPVDHSRLVEHSRLLDDDLERYADIFTERTAGCAEPFDINRCLNGSAQIMKPPAAAAAGLIHDIADVRIPAGTPTWWANS